MTLQLGSVIRLKPWLVGFLLSTAAMFFGYEFGSDTARLLGGEPGIWARASKGFVWGLIIAGMQWPVVRVVGVPPVRFTAASAVGFALGYPFGQTMQGLVVVDWRWNWVWGFGLALAIFGLSLGVPEWWIIRPHMPRAGLWIWLSVAGWMLTGVAGIYFGVNSGLDCIAYGIVTGPGLVWLVHSRVMRRKSLVI
jgi:hypothetical protein